MREHVFGEIDKDKDFLISMEEFMKGTQGESYEKDEGWKTVDDEEVRECSLFLENYSALSGYSFHREIKMNI